MAVVASSVETTSNYPGQESINTPVSSFCRQLRRIYIPYRFSGPGSLHPGVQVHTSTDVYFTPLHQVSTYRNKLHS
eukprot:3940832-Rhodomonas_salina.3